MNISEILKGVEAGTLQSVGYMQIIPLTRGEDYDQFCMPTEVLLSTENYGTMQVENTSDRMTILPFGTGVVTSQAAQNHATPKAKLLGGHQRADIPYAACTQETQGGIILPGQHPITILPWAIKEMALKTKDDQHYNKLWSSIREFNQSLGVRVTGHLELYLEQFKDDLDNFIAQFEVVPNQVGAIVLINGYVMGIELTPNCEYFKSVWNPLIRECYGSLALQYVKQFGDDPPMPRTRVPLNTNVSSLEQLQKEVQRVQSEESKKAKAIIRRFIKDEFNAEEEETVDGYTVETLSNKQFVGQIARKDDEVVYASFVTTGRGIRNRRAYEAENFTI